MDPEAGARSQRTPAERFVLYRRFADRYRGECRLDAQIDSLLVAPELLGEFARAVSLVEQSSKAWSTVLNDRQWRVFQEHFTKEGPQGIAALVHQDWLPLQDASTNKGKAGG
jgi:hypothetical protein